MTASNASNAIPLPDFATATPDEVISGHRIFHVWQPPALATHPPSMPKGILIEHAVKAEDGRTHRCVVWVPWISTVPNDEVWTLLSLHPLSIVEPFLCIRCGLKGGIREGNWWVGLT